MQGFGLSARKACRIVGITRTSFKYIRKIKPDEEIIRKRLRELAQKRIKAGYPKLHTLLRREKFLINHKRTERIYKEEKLSLNKKKKNKRRKVSSTLRIPVPRPEYINHVWSMDFVFDALVSKRRLKLMTLIDEYTRKCFTIETDTSIPSARVVDALNRVTRQEGFPMIIIIDNGPEFISNALDLWAYKTGVKLHFITRGQPVENAYIETFNGKFRNECLNIHWFLNLDYAKIIIEQWRIDYNCQRPHSSLDDLTPEEFAEREKQKTSQETALKKQGNISQTLQLELVQKMG